MTNQINNEEQKNEKVKNSNPKAILRVKSSSAPKALAGSITATMKEHGFASLKCIGDGAIGRGVKAVAIASGYLKPIGISIKITPYFFETEIDGETRTGISMDIEGE